MEQRRRRLDLEDSYAPPAKQHRTTKELTRRLVGSSIPFSSICSSLDSKHYWNYSHQTFQEPTLNSLETQWIASRENCIDEEAIHCFSREDIQFPGIQNSENHHFRFFRDPSLLQTDSIHSLWKFFLSRVKNSSSLSSRVQWYQQGVSEIHKMLCKHSSLSISIAAIETSEGDTLFNSCMKVLNLLVSSLLANNYTLGDGSILSNLTTDYTPDDITMIISCMEFTKKLLSEIGLRTYILENQTESVNQEEVRSMKFKPFLSSILNQTNFWIFTFGKFPKVSTSILKSQTSGLLILREVFDLIRPDFSVASSPRLDSSSQIQSLQSVEKNWEYLSSKNGETFEDWRLLEDIHDIGLQKLRDLHGIRPHLRRGFRPNF
eukprot:GHVP01053058.1.p1 GENE.GHVP01053058.1~~GHVP01053058.1.p1  ORF type:complete len:376 (+),score=55.50 GHVP01053058.1:40-1167(+)